MIYVLIMSPTEYVLLLNNHTLLFDDFASKFNATFEFWITVSYYLMFFVLCYNMFNIYIQVVDYPRLCNSILQGITRERLQPNGTEVAYIPKNIDFYNNRSVSINYTITYLTPQMDNIFIGHLLNSINVLKSVENSNFSELAINRCSVFFYHLSNLSCSRTHSTLLL